MTRKDYVALAAALNTTRPLNMVTADQWTAEGATGLAAAAGAYDLGRTSQWVNTVQEVADMLAADNPRFDRNRFIAACGGVS